MVSAAGSLGYSYAAVDSTSYRRLNTRSLLEPSGVWKRLRTPRWSTLSIARPGRDCCGGVPSALRQAGHEQDSASKPARELRWIWLALRSWSGSLACLKANLRLASRALMDPVRLVCNVWRTRMPIAILSGQQMCLAQPHVVIDKQGGEQQAEVDQRKAKGLARQQVRIIAPKGKSVAAKA